MDPFQMLTFFLCLHPLYALPLSSSSSSSSSATTPMNCTDTARICTSFIAFKPTSNTTLPLIESMFDVLTDSITVEESRDLGYVFVRKNCSCDGRLRNYLTSTTLTVREGDGGYVNDLVREAYGGLAYLPNWSSGSGRKARVGEVVGVRLFCGCSSGLWNYLMSYVIRDGDTVASLASRFGVSMDSIEQVNGISDPDNFTVGSLYYIPLDSVPGDPFPVVTSSPPAPAPTLSTTTATTSGVNAKKSIHLSYGWILAIIGVCLGFLVVVVVVCVSLKSSGCCSKGLRGHAKVPDGRNDHKFLILWSGSFCFSSGRNICCRSSDWKQPNTELSNDQINIPKVIVTNVYEMEKPVAFTYEEILTATEGFSEANLLGHGKYGSVYRGLLGDQEVAIRRMTATKSKEFATEMKVLCTVHHANLVELIGYATSGSTLSWIMRVQIALDAARGLEYIHEHTKIHYVHRDIKTSNICLDGAFRAKISDFGLAKLAGKANDSDVSATRVVGTYGYLSPEYLSEGLATSKSDVYAFGFVLFELISGKDAVIRTEGLMKNSERRSLVPIMLAAMRNVPDSTSIANMKDHIDPNLMDLYPHDCVFKMAMLAKQCVDDYPILRPDMKQVVIWLSQILLSSIEWEATLAGSGQIFSGLVQGR